MNVTSTASNYQTMLNELLGAENRETSAQQEVSSGKLADDLSGFGVTSGAIVAAQSVQTRVNGLVNQLNLTSTQLTFQQSSLTSLSSIAQQLQTALSSADGLGSGDDLMNQVQSLFNQAASALNTQYNGEYIFSGGATTTQPLSATTLSSLVPSGLTDTQLQALAASPDTSASYQNGSYTPVSRIDDNTTIQTGFLASGIGQSLTNVFQSIEAFQQSSNGNFGGDLTSAQQSFLESTISQLDSVVSSTNQTAAQGGNIQTDVTNALTTQQARATTMQTVIGDMTNADTALAATNLTEAQNAFEAAAQVFTTLKGMSLLNYLSTSTSA